MKKGLFLYFAALILFMLGLYAILTHGKELEKSREVTIAKYVKSEQVCIQPSIKRQVSYDIKESQSPSYGIVDGFVSTMKQNIKHPLGILLLQVIIIVTLARFCGYIASKLSQPPVIGEITAGIILGPSLIGYHLPWVYDFLFSAPNLVGLGVVSQIGLIFFMFLIGLELDINVLKQKANTAVAISHSSIMLSYFLGALAAYYLFLQFAPPKVPFLSFALFFGSALSITAFPVLARIISEKGLQKTNVGDTAIASAAADDVTAWCILAAVIAVISAGNASSTFFTLALIVVYLTLMITVAHPIMKRLEKAYLSKSDRGMRTIAFVFVFIFLSAFLTETIGIHTIFGAFMAGVVLSGDTGFKHILIQKIEDVALLVFLPLFFAFTGLRTELGLLNSLDLWLVCSFVICLAVIGKFGGSFIAAKLSGHNLKESLQIGVLMNTKGLMELIVLNIGYDMGILSPKLFTILVIVALFTTLITSPTLTLIEYAYRKK